MEPSPLLAYAEPCLPAPTPAARLELARAHHLALELADDGHLETDPYIRAGVPLTGLQAWRLRQDPPTHRDRERRGEASRHLGRTLERAARLGLSRVIAFCAYGHDTADRPFDRAVDFLAGFEHRARDWGVRLLLEAASPRAADALTDPREVARILDVLDAPQAFGLVLDTGSLADAAEDGGSEEGDVEAVEETGLDAFFSAWDRPVEEVQLGAAGGAPPPPGTPLGEWLAALPAPPAVVAVEHSEPIAETALRELVAALRGQGLE